MNTIRLTLSNLLAPAALASFAFLAGCAQESEATAADAEHAVAAKSEDAASPRDMAATDVDEPARELETYQTELLEFALDAAETIPYPKPRGVAKELVAVTALRLDAPVAARRYADTLENWRRGSLYGDLAMYYAGLDERERAAALADAALEVAKVTETEDPQSWRRGRIAAKIAHVYVLHDRGSEAAEMLAGFESPDIGIVDNARVKNLTVQELDAYLANVERAKDYGNLELVVYTFESVVELIERFYEDPARRKRLVATIEEHWDALPVGERVDLTIRLADVSLEHGDEERALELLGDAEDAVAGQRWSARAAIPLVARLAAMRHGAGDKAGARAGLREALIAYDEARPELTDIWRAETLRPIAEGYLTVGDVEQARAIYARALEEGNGNPNVKPRAEDLSATCCSMASSGFEPDESMWSRMRELREGLVQPASE